MVETFIPWGGVSDMFWIAEWEYLYLLPHFTFLFVNSACSCPESSSQFGERWPWSLEHSSSARAPQSLWCSSSERSDVPLSSLKRFTETMWLVLNSFLHNVYSFLWRYFWKKEFLKTVSTLVCGNHFSQTSLNKGSTSSQILIVISYLL